VVLAIGIVASLLTLTLAAGAINASAVDGPAGFTSALRFHAGAVPVTDSRGLSWGSDASYADGGSLHVTSAAITGTDDPQLYTAQRWGDFTYNVPVKNGSYRLQLSFAEIDPSAGMRAFTVMSGDRMLLDHFVITDHVKSHQALVVYLDVVVGTGSLPLQFVSDEGVAAVAGVELLRRSAAATTTTTVKTGIFTFEATDGSPSVSSASSSTAAVTPAMDGWKLVASDEFTGASINAGKWDAYSGKGNGGVGFRDPSHLRVTNGELQIVGVGDTSGGAAFKYSSTYGRFVIRAKQDVGHGYGPALMLWPDSEKWPEDGEIDISEMPEGDAKKSHFTLHWGADNSQDGVTATGDFSTWHTWTVEWMPDHLTFWLDGVQQKTFTNPAAIPDGPMHFAVQNDVGNATSWIANRNANTPAQVATHIDFVRVYAAA
jgi:hypothetical protein